MKNSKSRSKSSLFLMELIIVIMFFSLCAAICMQVFANAKVKTEFSRNVTNASFAAESVAEYYKEYQGNLAKLSNKFSVKSNSDLDADSNSNIKEIKIFYDKDWTACKEANAKFVMTVTEQEEDYIERALIDVKSIKGEDLFSVVSAVTQGLNGEVQ